MYAPGENWAHQQKLLGDYAIFLSLPTFTQGSLGLEKHVDTLFERTAYFTSFIRNREGFQLVLEEPPFVNVCFWYIPPSLRNTQNDEDYNEKLHRVR